MDFFDLIRELRKSEANINKAGKAMKKTANDIMTRDVHTVTESTPIEALAKAFSEKGVSGFPAVSKPCSETA